MGKPKHSNDPRGEQKGAQQHDEGQYGPKAFEAKRAEITDHSNSRRESQRAENDPRAGGDPHGEAELHERLIASPALDMDRDGGHRLFENRTQHDEAERASEKNRRAADVQRHKHDREHFQLPGGREAHPAAPDSTDGPIVKSTGDAAGNRSSTDRGGH